MEKGLFLESVGDTSLRLFYIISVSSRALMRSLRVVASTVS